jgi:hypothetical protein
MKKNNLIVIVLISILIIGAAGLYIANSSSKQSPIVQTPNSSSRSNIASVSSNNVSKITSSEVNKVISSSFSSNVIVNLSSAKPSESSKSSILKQSQVGVNIWKGVGLEPGFTLNINYDQVADNYPAELVFQNDGTVNGYLQLKSINGGAIMEYEGNLMVGGDGAVPVNIKINMYTECTKPNGQKTMNTVNIKFGDNQYKGCADWIGNGKSLLSPNKQAEIKKSFMEVPGIKSVNFTDKGVKVVGEIDEPAAGLAMKKSDEFKILLDGSEFSLKN